MLRCTHGTGGEPRSAAPPYSARPACWLHAACGAAGRAAPSAPAAAGTLPVAARHALTSLSSASARARRGSDTASWPYGRRSAGSRKSLKLTAAGQQRRHGPGAVSWPPSCRRGRRRAPHAPGMLAPGSDSCRSAGSLEAAAPSGAEKTRAERQLLRGWQGRRWGRGQLPQRSRAAGRRRGHYVLQFLRGY